ncbi:MAG: hypothetical protein IPJ74_18905 [Saprospiraceae bacterium]|nr:hypothetical protein [Saprospiraceae bacterium]
MMVEIVLEKNTIDNTLQIKTPQYIPIWRWREKTKDGKTNYRVIPISAYEEDATSIGMNATDHTAMLRYAHAVRKNLEKSEASEKKKSLQPATSNE